ncbi:MAG: hypothetical protein VKJ64_06270 [Leptolyngbyaceae bacterium]|nr:hypothetical protein [Leptolyngbyaceae bacterium]
MCKIPLPKDVDFSYQVTVGRNNSRFNNSPMGRILAREIGWMDFSLPHQAQSISPE